ncbi:MAG TPA: alcohol dehydrogenase catalytic domain-containing protein [Clostridiaceae bacterium]|nr:alcohol dehydrogenase catalytic domain-containing protein [Clostridiaceae bacterium]
MKAIVIHGPNDARYEEVPVKKPQDGEVVIKIKAAALCGTDYELYTNDMVYIKEGLCKLPMIPGHEWSGVITEVGPNVEGFKVGDKVSGECTVSCGKCSFCKKGQYNMCINRTETGVLSRDGAFAEYITFPVSHLHKFENISFEEAALIEPTGIALYAVMRSHISPLDNVLVMGPGPIGLLAAQIVKKVYGAKRVILSGTRKDRLDRAKGYDLDGLINVREEDLVERVREITNGEMIDTVVETSGGNSTLEDIKKVINPCGKVGMVGFFGAKRPECDWDSFITRDIAIYGSLGSPNVWGDVISMLESGKLEVKSIISHIMDMKSYDDFKNAMDMMVERRDNACKIILKP